MYATGTQRFFTYTGYYANGSAREVVRNFERATRPATQWVEKIQRIVFAILCVLVALFTSLPALGSYSLAAGIGKGRFELVRPEVPGNFEPLQSIRVVDLNACFQDPWSPFTGGVVSPFEPVGEYPSRIAALVDAIDEENPTIFTGQEFESLGAQDEFIRLMKQKGFRYFVRDLGSNDAMKNNSGLFVASKVPLHNLEFVPYPDEDRAGLAKWSNQGTLTFTVSVAGQEMRFVTAHLNYGDGKENQEARNRQLKHHVVPLLNRGKAVLFGDLNFNTASVEKAVSGLLGFVNALEGRITCTDEGKHTLRGKSRNPDGKPCPDCAERIDGLIYRPGQVRIIRCDVKPLVLAGKFLSDHRATVAEVALA